MLAWQGAEREIVIVERCEKNPIYVGMMINGRVRAVDR